MQSLSRSPPTLEKGGGVGRAQHTQTPLCSPQSWINLRQTMENWPSVLSSPCLPLAVPNCPHSSPLCESY